MIKENRCKKCRREGGKLFLKGDKCFTAKCPFTRKPYIPGQHGASSGRRRLSEYGVQLREKQKVRSIYGVREDQFRNYFKKAEKANGVTGEVLLRILELRLDSVLYRLGFADSRSQARQFISHEHVKVNGRKVKTSSYIVKVGSKISFSESFKKTETFKAIEDKAKGNKNLQDWLKLDAKTMEGSVEKEPARDNIDQEINENLIVEFYSR